MDNTTFLSEFKNKINKIRDNEFKNFNFEYTENVIEKKELYENSMEFKKFQINVKKKAIQEKQKPGNIGKKEYESNNSVDILEDDIFNNTFKENQTDEVKLDIESFDREKKLSLIYDFLQRKNIILEEYNLKKIEEIVDNPEITLKKFLNVSKIYQQITRITFIKKLENGSYIVDINENKPRKTKKYFFK
jgi:hypothetical protein